MRKILSAFGLFVAGALMTGTAYAQCPDFPGLGDTYICHFVNGQKVVTLPGGPAPSNSDGSATVVVSGFNYNPCQVIFEVVDFNSNGTGEFGAIDASLVPTGVPTTLTAQDAASGNLFPANLDLNIGLKAELGGNTYYTDEILNLQATDIHELPLKGVSVKQTRPVRFFSEDGADIFFSLDETSVELNP